MSLSRKTRRARQRNSASGDKMSEVLADIALPMLQQLPDGDFESYEMTFKIAALLWNASRVQDEEVRARALAELLEDTVDEGSSELEALFRHVIARAERLYPRLDRLISRVDVVPRPDGRFDVKVLSTGR
ncbi:MAG TPA: hypothetical protein VEX86_11850 [Longimicrobium sp.]|nr:hypothetical protein [Longimicrobium sp.]